MNKKPRVQGACASVFLLIVLVYWIIERKVMGITPGVLTLAYILILEVEVHKARVTINTKRHYIILLVGLLTLGFVSAYGLNMGIHDREFFFLATGAPMFVFCSVIRFQLTAGRNEIM